MVHFFDAPPDIFQPDSDGSDSSDDYPQPAEDLMLEDATSFRWGGGNIHALFGQQSSHQATVMMEGSNECGRRHLKTEMSQ